MGPSAGYNPGMHPLSTTLRIKRLHELAQLPVRMTEDSSGFDLCACLPNGPIFVAPGSTALVPCGFSMALDRGYEGQVRPRSGFALKGISVANAPGTIDSDYRGEIKVILLNNSADSFEVPHGARIAQLVIAAVARVALAEVEELDSTARGDGGFGSTGTT